MSPSVRDLTDGRDNRFEYLYLTQSRYGRHQCKHWRAGWWLCCQEFGLHPVFCMLYDVEMEPRRLSHYTIRFGFPIISHLNESGMSLCLFWPGNRRPILGILVDNSFPHWKCILWLDTFVKDLAGKERFVIYFDTMERNYCLIHNQVLFPQTTVLFHNMVLMVCPFDMNRNSLDMLYAIPVFIKLQVLLSHTSKKPHHSTTSGHCPQRAWSMSLDFAKTLVCDDLPCNSCTALCQGCTISGVEWQMACFFPGSPLQGWLGSPVIENRDIASNEEEIGRASCRERV